MRPALTSSLHAATAWFHSMTSPAKRLHYAFEPATGIHRDENCPIRDVGTAADLAVLQRHLHSSEFDPVRRVRFPPARLPRCSVSGS